MKEKALQGSLWLGPGGNYGVIIVNISDSPHEGVFFIPEKIDVQKVVQYDSEKTKQEILIRYNRVSVKISAADSLFINLETITEREE